MELPKHLRLNSRLPLSPVGWWPDKCKWPDILSWRNLSRSSLSGINHALTTIATSWLPISVFTSGKVPLEGSGHTISFLIAVRSSEARSRNCSTFGVHILVSAEKITAGAHGNLCGIALLTKIESAISTKDGSQGERHSNCQTSGHRERTGHRNRWGPRTSPRVRPRVGSRVRSGGSPTVAGTGAIASRIWRRNSDRARAWTTYGDCSRTGSGNWIGTSSTSRYADRSTTTSSNRYSYAVCDRDGICNGGRNWEGPSSRGISHEDEKKEGYKSIVHP